MEKIKILHISETFISGVYTYIKQLSSYAESNGNFETYIIYSGERIETNEGLFKQDFSPNISLIRVDMTREISFFRDIKSFMEILRQIRQIKPDVIHVHSSKAGVLGRVAAFFYPKARLYYTPHSYSFHRQDISRVKKQFFFMLEKAITKVFGGTIVACGDYEYYDAQKFGKAVLVRNGVDFNSLSSYKMPFHNEKLTIGTCSRIYQQKNPELFNQIALRLPEYQFVWIGDGELKTKLIAENITVTGWKTYHESLEAMNGLDVFLTTSLWEGLPFSNIEAMVLSKPIVSSNIDGNRVTVNHGQNGFLCSSVVEFVEAIKKMEDSNLRELFGKESFSIADTLFNMDKNVVDILNIYSGKYPTAV